MTTPDARRHSPAAERNRTPILELLRRVLPTSGTALEIASGTGQHAVHFAAGLPGWVWRPSDPDPSALASIALWAGDAGLPNLRPAIELDVRADPWPVRGPFDAIFCANMLHISPWATCAALMAGAARCAAPGALLLTYGPYFVHGQAPAPGNLAFDADLRQRDPEWGLRHVHDVEVQARRAGWILREAVAMPANNLMLVFDREQD